MEETNVKSEKKLCMYCKMRVGKKCQLKDTFIAKKKSCPDFRKR